MFNLNEIQKQAQRYAECYKKQGCDPELVQAVYVQHLGYLVNQALNEKETVTYSSVLEKAKESVKKGFDHGVFSNPQVDREEELWIRAEEVLPAIPERQLEIGLSKPELMHYEPIHQVMMNTPALILEEAILENMVNELRRYLRSLEVSNA